MRIRERSSSQLLQMKHRSYQALRRGQTRCPMDILECYHQERKDALDCAVEK